MIFGISGGSGSGKSHIVKYIKEKFSNSKLSFINQDNYYKKRENQIKDEKGKYNFDLPSSFKNQELIDDMISLKNGIPIKRIQYNFNNSGIQPKTLITHPKSIIILEGLFIFSNKKICSYIDYKIFIDVSTDTMLKRRIKRDSEQRGYDSLDVEYKFKNHVLPSYKKYILPQKNKSDLVINNDLDNLNAACHVHKLINEQFFL
ncbi:MAG: uridine kinase [Amoebophilaceae bacterium TMED152]|nr:MAG: uridine kinase [Amoebophilaceae bacterium TMED152]|tara:strand:- start:5760 stop:6368 length:609 start_codon:yes stop_codon:yes gene_type:complete